MLRWGRIVSSRDYARWDFTLGIYSISPSTEVGINHLLADIYALAIIDQERMEECETQYGVLYRGQLSCDSLLINYNKHILRATGAQMGRSSRSHLPIRGCPCGVSPPSSVTSQLASPLSFRSPLHWIRAAR